MSKRILFQMQKTPWKMKGKLITFGEKKSDYFKLT